MRNSRYDTSPDSSCPSGSPKTKVRQIGKSSHLQQLRNNPFNNMMKCLQSESKTKSNIGHSTFHKKRRDKSQQEPEQRKPLKTKTMNSKIVTLNRKDITFKKEGEKQPKVQRNIRSRSQLVGEQASPMQAKMTRQRHNNRRNTIKSDFSPNAATCSSNAKPAPDRKPKAKVAHKQNKSPLAVSQPVKSDKGNRTIDAGKSPLKMQNQEIIKVK